MKVRYKELRKGVLSNRAINKYIDQHAKLLAPCVDHHFETYPELLVSEEQKQQMPAQQPFGGFGGGFPMMGGFSMPDSIPQFSGGFPPMGGFPMPEGFSAPDSIPGGFNFPPMGMMGGRFPFGGFPMSDSIHQFPGGFPPMGGFPMPEGFSMPDSISQFPGGFPMMGGFGGDAIGWFAAYRVSSYDEEIRVLKKWLADRLAFLDRNIDGQQYQVPLFILQTRDTTEVPPFKHEYMVEVESVTPARFRYILSASSQGGMTSFFAEQGEVYSNVEGALGIFAGSAKRKFVFSPDTLVPMPIGLPAEVEAAARRVKGYSY